MQNVYLATKKAGKILRVAEDKKMLFCEKCKKEIKRSAVSIAKRHNKNEEVTSFMLVCPSCAAEIRMKKYARNQVRVSKVLKQKEHRSRPAAKSSKV